MEKEKNPIKILAEIDGLGVEEETKKLLVDILFLSDFGKKSIGITGRGSSTAKLKIFCNDLGVVHHFLQGINSEMYLSCQMPGNESSFYYVKWCKEGEGESMANSLLKFFKNFEFGGLIFCSF